MTYRVEFIKATEVIVIEDGYASVDDALSDMIHLGYEESSVDLLKGITTVIGEDESVAATIRYYQEDRNDAYPTLVVTRFRGWMCDAWEKYRRIDNGDVGYTVERVA